MNYILFDSEARENLLPFAHTRPVADIRCGILTMRERWEHLLGTTTGTLTQGYMQACYEHTQTASETIYINGAVMGNNQIAQQIAALSENEVLTKDGIVIAARMPYHEGDVHTLNEAIDQIKAVAYDGELVHLRNIWDIFSLNETAINNDWQLLTQNKKSAPIPEGIVVNGKDNLFIEEGAVINAGTIINAKTGYVYVGKDAEILEGSLLRGPVAVCEHAVIKMGAKIYGATTIGPGCKVGGEINNVVFFANSNKSHDGYLGNAVIGEWCNLGADTNCSNLKNNYDVVKVWHEASQKEVNTGLTFCGLLMGDHSKCGINTMFNTGTVVGVSCNIYGGGFPDKNIPSFSWGGSEGFITYRFDKAMETANKMMGRRNKQLSSAEIAMYQHLFDNATKR
jgi:UDP-N-acetylglucosamine diphosphorylase/glucosamine-1-phosphate N-acetyltransferase